MISNTVKESKEKSQGERKITSQCKEDYAKPTEIIDEELEEKQTAALLTANQNLRTELQPEREGS